MTQFERENQKAIAETFYQIDMASWYAIEHEFGERWDASGKIPLFRGKSDYDFYLKMITSSKKKKLKKDFYLAAKIVMNELEEFGVKIDPKLKEHILFSREKKR
ncbi:MAG: hypothetical protein IBX45_13430 [Campylobacterales bacterium]|nr:hypothetical protein [Campylobacterales bacterium]